MDKKTNLRPVRNKLLDELGAKKEVIAYECYADLCTRRQFVGQIQIVKNILDIEMVFFNKGSYVSSPAAYKVFYNN